MVEFLTRSFDRFNAEAPPTEAWLIACDACKDVIRSSAAT